MTSITKNVDIDKLDDIANKYKNEYHRATKMKPVDVTSRTYIGSRKEINDRDWKYKIVDIARISKYKNIFAEGNVPNWSEEAFVIKKLKSNEPQIITDFKSKKLVGTFYKKDLQKTN